MRTITIGVDQGRYSVREDTRQIVLADLGFEPTIEALLYVLNITQNKMYYAAAATYAKEVTITHECGVGYILEYKDLSTFDELGADDVLHIQFVFPVNVQEPLPVDGDSVYGKDLDLPNCTIEGFTFDDETLSTCTYEIIKSMVSDVYVNKSNDSTDNPKTIYLRFKRPILTTSFGINSGVGKYFSNTKITIYQGDYSAVVVDESADNTQYQVRLFGTGPIKFSAIKIEFYTANEVSIGLIGIFKNTEVAARLQALKPNGTVTDIDATNGGNLKVSLEEYDDTFLTNPLPIQVRSSDGGETLYIEQLTHGMPNINTDHALIHFGYGYSFGMLINTLAGSGTKEYCLTSPTDRYIHLKNVNIQVLGSSIQVEIIKDATVTTNTGTLVSINNLNHNSTNTASSTIRENPSYTGGTTVRTIYALADSTNQTTGNANFNENPNQEFVTKSGNEEYIIKVTNLTGNDCIVSIDAFMYEESQGLST